MKQVLKAAGGLLIFVHIAIGILIVTIIGCGEVEEETITAEFTGDAATAVGTIGEMKVLPDAAPGAPSVPTDGTPYVKSVGYYSDWQLTEKLSGTVAPGKTIFIKVVFSEPMVHTVADDNKARPILYYRVAKEQHRFKVAKHGASGEDFVSGDAKPLGGGTDDYIAKYTVPADVDAKFRVEIGKFNADLDGNYLPAFYTHKEQLQLGQAAVETQAQTTATKQPQEPPTTPAATQQPATTADTTPPTVLSVTHYEDRTGAVIAEGETVSAGTTINTEVVFSEPVKPAITYATNNGKEHLYTLSPKGGVHWHRLCKPVNEEETIWLCKQSAFGNLFSVTVTTDTTDLAGNRLTEPVTTTVPLTPPVVAPKPADTTDNGGDIFTVPRIPPPVIDFFIHADQTSAKPSKNSNDFVGRIYAPTSLLHVTRHEAQPITGVTVTIVTGPRSGESVTTDRDGYYLFPDVQEDELHLLAEKEYFEPKEVIVHRSRPTSLPNRVTLRHYGDPQHNPGNILIGQRWPDEVRFIFEETLVVYDLLYVEGGMPPGNKNTGGFYNNGVIVIYSTRPAYNADSVLITFAHEIAHAHQSALLSVSGGAQGLVSGWAKHPEGRAFAEARRRDQREFGRSGHDIRLGVTSLDEYAAEVCAYYWGVDRWGVRRGDNLKVTAPNQLKWAETWLRK